MTNQNKQQEMKRNSPFWINMNQNKDNEQEWNFII